MRLRSWWSGWVGLVLVGVVATASPAGADSVSAAGDVVQFVPALMGLGLTYWYDADAERHARVEAETTPATGDRSFAYRALLGRDATGRLQLLESGVLTGAATLLLKATVDKKRPNGHDHSFPSGHTADAAFGAMFLQRRYGWWYGVPAFALTGFVAWSRVESREHFAEDVIAGAGIGFVSSLIFTRPWHGVEIAPTAGGGTYGVALRASW
ncbi:MAG: phosphatase PAP2 family protein [Myxococcales bacterium]|nr:phosphatase PAP2 family protein [Myxococcales bacterium]